ncbi:MAG: ABC transporter ATP-binding protein [Bacteroidetes bacterium]|nr:ABC transporter ATP-binding protein [Bacteroidota bacterium]
MEVARASAISIEHLNFRYSENSGVVFQDFNLQIAAGERFGLLGPNGAGKTTLMNLMTGVLQKNEGSIKILGRDTESNRNEVKKTFGFIPQQHSFYNELSPVENLQFFGAWSGLEGKEIKQRTEELLEVLGLSAVANKAVSKFSGGMKSRVNLAIGVIHRPQILFLDEPTTGVDVQTRHAIIDYLKQLNATGTTLVYTSHHLTEAESLCTRVALIDEGKIIAQNDTQTLLCEHQQTGLEGLFLQLTGRSYRDS